MFDPEKEVPSLKLCKRLKELGYPQKDGGWYWDKYFVIDRYFWRVCMIEAWDRCIEELARNGRIIKAPTVRELGEWLLHRINPSSIEFSDYFLSIDKFNDGWQIGYRRFEELSESFSWEVTIFDESEANARAKMLIWLVENGYVKFPTS